VADKPQLKNTKVGSDASRYRKLGKKIVLGLNNGRSPYSIYVELAREGFGYDMDDVQCIVGLYYNRFPGIRTWREGNVASSIESGSISTKMGRTLKVSKDVNINSLCNDPLHGTAADGFKIALIDLDGKLAGQDARIVHILHDEIIVEAREDIAEDLAVIVTDCMERAFVEIFPDVPFVVNPEIRDSWG